MERAYADSARGATDVSQSMGERMTNALANLVSIANRVENMGGRVHGVGPSDGASAKPETPNHLTWQMTAIEQEISRLDILVSRVAEAI